jgi:hypothetical protein
VALQHGRLETYCLIAAGAVVADGAVVEEALAAVLVVSAEVVLEVEDQAAAGKKNDIKKCPRHCVGGIFIWRDFSFTSFHY